MKSEISLRKGHLIICPELSDRIFESSSTSYVSFNKESNSLLVSPSKNSWFPKMHKSLEFMLKDRDMLGTKSIAIMEMFLDHDIDDTDRTLTYTLNEEKQFLKIALAK
jgi:hypothetical protein